MSRIEVPSRFVLGDVIGLLKKYGPKHMKADVAYGMEDSGSIRAGFSSAQRITIFIL